MKGQITSLSLSLSLSLSQHLLLHINIPTLQIKIMVEMKNEVLYPLFYSLVILALILPVATVTVERIFLAMNIIDYTIECKING